MRAVSREEGRDERRETRTVGALAGRHCLGREDGGDGRGRHEEDSLVEIERACEVWAAAGAWAARRDVGTEPFTLIGATFSSSPPALREATETRAGASRKRCNPESYSECQGDRGRILLRAASRRTHASWRSARIVATSAASQATPSPSERSVAAMWALADA